MGNEHVQHALFPSQSFRWSRGYAWTETIDGKRLLYAVGSDEKMSNLAYSRRWTRADIGPDVLRAFAHLDAREESILLFANEYGDWLGESRSKYRTVQGDSLWGTTFADWKDAIEDVRFWFLMWGKVQSGRHALLKTDLIESRAGWECAHPRGIFLLEDGDGPMRTRGNGRGRLGLARAALRDAVNARLVEHPTRTVVTLGDDGTYDLGFRSGGLLAILWLHFAQVITGSFRIQRCENQGCTRFLTQVRSTKRFCSDACRANATATRKRVERNR